MHEKFNLLKIQNELGYVFKDDALIKAAFVHRSFDAKGEENNVRLIFLGKQLLSFVLCDYITSRLPYSDEKQLSYQTESYISALKTERYLKEHGLEVFIMMSGINEPMRTASALGKEIFYAIIAAIYRDGGLPALKGFLMPMIRACGSDTHYQPATEGKIITGSDENTDGVAHIKSQRLRRPAKSGSIGFSKAETLNTDTEKEPKKEKGISRLLKKKTEKEDQKSEKAPKKDVKPTKTEKKTTEEPNGEKPERSFIRDPFAPVRLSDELRNFKPKKPSKYDEKPVEAVNAAPAPVKKKSVEKPTAPVSEHNEDSDTNYKSLLQEYVQKNIRTANVLLKYNAFQAKNGKWAAEIKLQDKSIALANGDSKKEAEKNAAMMAYNAIRDRSTKEHKWFCALNNGNVAVSEPATDYVSRINQHYQKLNKSSVSPVTYEKKSSGKRGEIHIAAMLDGKEIAVGKASNLKEAKQNAAKAAAEKLGI